MRPASRARSLPGSKLPDEALPPLEAISRWCDVSGVGLWLWRKHDTCEGTYLLVGVHAGEAAAVAGMAALGRDLPDFLLGASDTS